MADTGHECIRKINKKGVITTVVGIGTSGFSGDGGAAVSAQLNDPKALAVDAHGNLFITDGYNIRIRKVDPKGIISTLVGDGLTGYTGDGGPAAQGRTSTRPG